MCRSGGKVMHLAKNKALGEKYTSGGEIMLWRKILRCGGKIMLLAKNYTSGGKIML